MRDLNFKAQANCHGDAMARRHAAPVKKPKVFLDRRSSLCGYYYNKSARGKPPHTAHQVCCGRSWNWYLWSGHATPRFSRHHDEHHLSSKLPADVKSRKMAAEEQIAKHAKAEKKHSERIGSLPITVSGYEREQTRMAESAEMEMTAASPSPAEKPANVVVLPWIPRYETASTTNTAAATEWPDMPYCPAPLTLISGKTPLQTSGFELNRAASEAPVETAASEMPVETPQSQAFAVVFEKKPEISAPAGVLARFEDIQMQTPRISEPNHFSFCQIVPVDEGIATQQPERLEKPVQSIRPGRGSLFWSGERRKGISLKVAQADASPPQ